jgi:ribosome maturation factor RimP
VAIDKEPLADLIAPWVEAEGFELVRVSVMKAPGRSRGLTVQVLAERPGGGMSVDDCAKLNRALSERLDAVDPIHGAYVLEVSSPGIDRPLVRRGDFERFAGQQVRLETTEPVAGRRRFKGRLLGLSGEAVLVDVEGERMAFALDSIAKAKLAASEALAAAKRGG